MRVGGHERLHVAAHVVETHRVDGGDPDRPLHALARRREVGARPREALEEGTRGLVEGPSLRGRLERPARAVEELGVQLGLELLDRLARPGLGDAVGGGAPGDAPQAHHVAEELDRVEVHGVAQSTLSTELMFCFRHFLLG